MNSGELFHALAPLLAPMLEADWERRDLCILATRVAIEVARHFGVDAQPLPVKVILYNAPFAKRVESGIAAMGSPRDWDDGSWSVGIGCGKPNEPGRWDGHLIVVADGVFADYSIQQAERLEHRIITGNALVGPYTGEQMWKAENDQGTVIEYSRIADDTWRKAPDWKDEKRRRPIVGKLIRALREMEKCA